MTPRGLAGSSPPGEASPRPRAPAARRRWALVLYTALAVYWTAMLALTHWPRIELPELPRRMPADKMLHYAGYGGLGVLLTAAVLVSRGPHRPVRPAVYLGVLRAIALYALVDEATQPWFARKSDWFDGVADLLGAASGIVLVALAAGVWTRFGRRGPAAVDGGRG